jgi:hypothetical protein
VSQIFSRDGADPETQPRRQIDNRQLYENIGNIVIQKAHAGDNHCLEIYKRAWQLSSNEQKEPVAGLDGKSKPAADSILGDGSTQHGIRHLDK